jgi:predicted transcriptional regulator
VIVLIDRQGSVRLYHPGAMTEQELKSAIDSVM